MPLKIAGNEISTMDELIVAMSVPSVVLDSAIHLYRGWSTGSTRTPFTAREVAQPVEGRQGRRDGRPVAGRHLVPDVPHKAHVGIGITYLWTLPCARCHTVRFRTCRRDRPPATAELIGPARGPTAAPADGRAVRGLPVRSR